MRQILSGTIGLACALASTLSPAATPLESLRYSPDTTAALGSQTVNDEDVAEDDLAGTVAVLSLGTLPAETDLDGYHLLSNGDQLFSCDTTVDLPGGIVAGRGDVVRFDGAGYSIELDAEANGVPNGVDIDALSVFGDDLLVSFDVTVELDGLTFQDEDLAVFDGASFGMFLDGSSVGVGTELAVDAAHYIDCNDHLLLSFDGSGSVGTIVFDDEDVLEYAIGAGSWDLAYDGSGGQATWRPADLDAVHATADPGPGPPTVFGQTVLASGNKVDFEWPNPVDFIAVRGDFVTAGDIGAYAFDTETSGSGTLISDLDVPAGGSGFWYLLRLRGCELTSWQTILGAEPGRDAVLP